MRSLTLCEVSVLQPLLFEEPSFPGSVLQHLNACTQPCEIGLERKAGAGASVKLPSNVDEDAVVQNVHWESAGQNTAHLPPYGVEEHHSAACWDACHEAHMGNWGVAELKYDIGLLHYGCPGPRSPLGSQTVQKALQSLPAWQGCHPLCFPMHCYGTHRVKD